MATLATHSQPVVWGSATDQDGNSSANPRPEEPRSSSGDFPAVYTRDHEIGDEDNGSSNPLLQDSQSLKAPTTPDTPNTESAPAYSEALGGVFPMDEALIEALPAGSTFVSVEHFGTSAWTITGKVTARDADDESEQYYFVKIAYGETGRVMLGGDPSGTDKYHAQSPETYFYLSEFVDMDVTTPPDPAEFTSRLALMHKLSKSPTGKFGFHVRTCDGDRAHVVDWQESWAEFYRNLFLGVCELDLKRNGPWPEYERAINQIAWKVIPRLLEPLQGNGRKLKPCIIHGDLWEGNMGINMETGDSLLFDAGSYFAHNEMELGHWRCEFSSVFRAEVYTRQYLRHYPAAEPAEEFDDRIRLYSLKGAINYSAGHVDSDLRKTAYNNMCYLCEKYAPIDGIAPYNPLIDLLSRGHASFRTWQTDSFEDFKPEIAHIY
ncbi:hypothetical protein N656DRAFT_828446 [Canariomyces notabilis]|uniref:protein-ribulosamine 3-kinase n=1 Tax=Canariomyces notabilis TaxID=2074819 RepID=A0AAN6TGA9_9PEZI|nr:hypothetical protein N656DRAFT_828446 [Canariomyces arenarius]